MRNEFRIIGMIVILILGIAHLPAVAEEYPTKPITVICPFAPGGIPDVLGRLFASVAEKHLGKPLVVVNKGGASGMLGMVVASQAAPDGYTLALDASVIGNAIEGEIANGRKPPFTRSDFIPIGFFTLSPAVIDVPYDSPWKTLSDLIKDCKAKPDYYAFCSGGPFSGSHISAEVFMKATGIKARHVPYTGGGPCLAGLVGGHVHFTNQFPATSIPFARGNKLRILAVQGDRRLKSIPEVPTVKELGIAAEHLEGAGISVPQKTPPEIVKKLGEVFKKVVEDRAFITAVENTGDDVRYMSAEEVVKFWRNESEELSKLYKELLGKSK